jgi:serine/threonine protein phosphatase PrpC
MGGLEYGESASAEVCKIFNAPIDGDPKQHLQSKTLQANKRLFSQKDRQGATLSVVAIDRESGIYYALSVGDSRIYKYSKLNLVQLSEDDTPLPSEAQTSLNVITKAIGIKEEIAGLDIITGQLSKGDSLLLTTDGIHSSLNTDDIKETIQLFKKTQVVHELTKQSINRGTGDDMAAIYLFMS